MRRCLVRSSAAALLMAAALAAALPGTAGMALAAKAAQQTAPLFESADYRIKDGTSPVITGGVAYLFAGDDPWTPPGVNSSIVALSAADGSLAWQKELEWAGGMGSKARPLVENGRLYIGCGKSVYCLDINDNGTIVWQKDITPAGGALGNSVIISDPVAYTAPDNARVIVVGDFIYGRYVGLDASDGDILWTYALDANSSASGAPAVNQAAHRLYLPQSAAFGSPVNGKVHCIDVSGAAPVMVWGYATEYDVAGPIAFDQGSLFFSDFAYGGPMSSFYRIDDAGTSPALGWKQPIWGSSGLPLVNADTDTVFICGNDWGAGGNHYYAFDLATGELVWDNPNWGAYNGNSCISPVSGYLYAGSFDTGTWAHNKGIGAVDPFTGSELWLVTEKGGGDPVYSNGLVYTTADGRLYAYEEYAPDTFDWYFAEGYTGPGFEEWLTLANMGDTPEDDTAAHVVYFYSDGREPLLREYPVPHASRVTVSVNGEAGADAEVSMMVLSEAPLVAERPMYFDYRGKWTGGHVVLGADQPLNRWYFAEGYTGPGFEEWLTLLNFGDATTATVTYRFNDGSAPLEKQYALDAESRRTVNVNEEVGEGREVSMEVTTPPGYPVVAERPMYFEYQGLGAHGWTGGHCVMGMEEAAQRWYFAEGYTGPGFEEWLTLLNPGDAKATVTVDFLYQGEDKVSKQYEVGAGSRRTLNINEEAGAGKQLGLLVTSNQPVLAERPLYFDYQGKWDGGSCVTGAAMPSTFWVLAEGFTSPDFDEYITLSNPGKEEATVALTPLFGGGEPEVLEVAGGQRLTLALSSELPVERAYAIFSDRGIVVERPMYFDYQGLGAHGWTGGHCSKGATLRDIY